MFVSLKWGEEKTRQKQRNIYRKWNRIYIFPLGSFLYCYNRFMVWPIVMRPSTATLCCYGLHNPIQPEHFPDFVVMSLAEVMQWGIMGKEIMANWTPYIFQHFSALDVPQVVCLVSTLDICWTGVETATWEASRRTVTSVSLQLWQHFLWQDGETVIYSSWSAGGDL